MDWFRSWHGAPTDPKWMAIARRANVVPGVVASVVWCLMDLASQNDDRGSIEGYDAEVIATFYGYEPEQVEAVVTALRDKQIIVGERFKAWEIRQPKRERDDDSSERVRKHRASKELSDVTPCNATSRQETPPDTDTDKKEEPPVSPLQGEPEPKPSKSKRGTRIPDDFAMDREFGRKLNLTETEIETEQAKMLDHFRSAPGARGVKLDWPATGRNWLRKAAEMKPAWKQKTATDPPQDNGWSREMRELQQRVSTKRTGPARWETMKEAI